MAGASARRPIPAVVFILLLSLLSAIVWYRVLNRTPASAEKAATPTTTSRSCAPKPATTTSAKSKTGTTTTPAKTTPKATAVVWPLPASVHVTVLNGTSRVGLAKSVAGQLKTRGFEIGTISNDSVSTLTVSQVRYGPALATAARLVQLYLPGSRLVPNSGKATSVTVSLGSSYSRLSTNAAVARAKRSATSTTC